MSVFTCPCGNTSRWRNLHTGPDGTYADCAACGTRVDDPTVTTPMTIQISQTDSTVIGDNVTQINFF